jgi:hypothetical protein
MQNISKYILISLILLLFLGAKSDRFLTPKERYPENTPGWFKELDINNQGQVFLKDWCDKNGWTQDSIKEFQKYDKNDDGVITLQEIVPKQDKKTDEKTIIPVSPKPTITGPTQNNQLPAQLIPQRRGNGRGQPFPFSSGRGISR